MNKSKVPELYNDLYEWIEKGPIVEAIISALWGEGLSLDLEDGKYLWCRALEELPEVLSRQAQIKVDSSELVEMQVPEKKREVPF